MEVTAADGTSSVPSDNIGIEFSITFAEGAAVTFTVLGVVASLASRLMGTSASWWYIILGILMVLMALLAIVAGKENILWGMLLLLLYSIGHGILAIVAGTSIGFVQKLSSSEKYGKASTILKVVMGALILLIGFYMFYLGF